MRIFFSDSLLKCVETFKKSRFSARKTCQDSIACKLSCSKTCLVTTLAGFFEKIPRLSESKTLSSGLCTGPLSQTFVPKVIQKLCFCNVFEHFPWEKDDFFMNLKIIFSSLNKSNTHLRDHSENWLLIMYFSVPKNKSSSITPI